MIAFPQVWLDLPLSPESQSLALGAALGVLTMKRALVVVGLAVLLLALLVYWHVISASTFGLILILAAAVAVYLVLIRAELKTEIQVRRVYPGDAECIQTPRETSPMGVVADCVAGLCR